MHLEYKDSGIAEAQNKTIKDLKLCGKGTLNGSGKVQQIDTDFNNNGSCEEGFENSGFQSCDDNFENHQFTSFEHNSSNSFCNSGFGSGGYGNESFENDPFETSDRYPVDDFCNSGFGHEWKMDMSDYDGVNDGYSNQAENCIEEDGGYSSGQWFNRRDEYESWRNLNFTKYIAWTGADFVENYDEDDSDQSDDGRCSRNDEVENWRNLMLLHFMRLRDVKSQADMTDDQYEDFRKYIDWTGYGADFNEAGYSSDFNEKSDQHNDDCKIGRGIKRHHSDNLSNETKYRR
ncbi:hypothetical protein DdX_16257 [Ditylenchus destructor]|uniref:Uncharacterized protein n=1 Tax=Ditylenchus destructor TaxID=166010 RepID=A0AAD4R017_9BILA|nr:hypothetical protein DdX_16257 [Ditylenchus destructor]